MTVLTQGIQPLEFLLSEADGARSRDEVTVTVSGGVALAAGTVLGKITASGKYIAYSDAASDGSQAAAAILGNPLAGVNGDHKCLVFTRDCEVMGSMLTGLDSNGTADLKALHVIVR